MTKHALKQVRKIIRQTKVKCIYNISLEKFNTSVEVKQSAYVHVHVIVYLIPLKQKLDNWLMEPWNFHVYQFMCLLQVILEKLH